MFPFFVFRKSCLIKSCSSSEDLSEYKVSWYYIERFKFYLHLQSFVRHFVMVAATAFKNYGVEVTFSDMTSLLNFIKIYQLVQKLIWG
jgi:hypothetical protein